MENDVILYRVRNVTISAADARQQNSPALPHTPETSGNECREVPTTGARRSCRKFAPERNTARPNEAVRSTSAPMASLIPDKRFPPRSLQRNHVRLSPSQSRHIIDG